MNKNTPDIAVSVITYNHEKFIGHAIDSIVNQKTEYKIKLFISDDKSTDNTAAVCRKYADKHPEIIDLAVLDQNIGIIPNWMFNYQRCVASGAPYIANCDGDDFWIDPLKTQKQLDFFSNNPDYAMSFSDTELIDYDNNRLETSPYFKARKKLYKSGNIFWDLLKSNFINTSSICLRTDSLVNVFPLDKKAEKRKWFIYDYWLWLHISKDHKIHFFNETFSAYRTHSQNITSESVGFFNKRPPYVLLDVISDLDREFADTPEKKDLIAKTLLTLILKRKTSFQNKLKASYYLLKFPPRLAILKHSINKSLKIN